jgi:hypothetical protein
MTMLMAGRRAAAVLIALPGLVAASRLVWPADCNENGVEDSLEVSGSLAATQHVSLAPAGQPSGLATADLNGDGANDLAVLVYQGAPLAAVIAIHISDLAGGYAHQRDLAVVTPSTDVIAVDLDHDDDQDLVVLQSVVDEVAVHLNDGEGGFAPPRNHAVGTTTRALTSMAPVDIDLDGDPDLAITSDRETILTVLLNDGQGGFPARIEVDAGGETRQVAPGDFDADGLQDLAVVGEDEIGVIIQEDGGQFAGPVGYLVIIESNRTIPRRILAGDMSGDGLADLVSVGTARAVSIHVNDGLGAFGDRTDVPVHEEPGDSRLGDLDGDGDLDMAVTSEIAQLDGCDQQVMTLLWNQGEGRLGDEEILVVGLCPTLPAASDMDGDGDLDLLTANHGAGDLSIVRNQGQGSFFAPRSLIGKGGSRALAAADLDGDGRVDVAAADADSRGEGGFSIFWNEEGSGLSAGERFPLDRERTGPRAIETGDLNGDGLIDAVTQTRAFLNLGSRSFETLLPPCHEGCAFSSRGLALADSSGDGLPDIIGLNSSRDALKFLENQGDATFQGSGSYPAGEEIINFAAADFDHDGHLDLAVGFGLKLVILRGLGESRFAEPEEHDLLDAPLQVEAIDLDQDSHLDIVLVTYLSLSILWNSGDGTFSAPVNFHETDNPKAFTVLDHDQDGTLDVAATAESEVLIFLNRGDRTLERGISRLAGPSPGSILAADLDDRAGTDLAVASGTGLTVLPVAIAASPDCNGNGVPDSCELDGNDCDANEVPDECDLQADAVSFGGALLSVTGNNPRALAVGDLDGDGHQDLAVASGTGQETLVMLENDGQGRFTRAAGTLVRDPSALVTGDFDRDGRLDLAVTAQAGPTGSDEPPADGVSIYMNRGDWSFTDRVHHDVTPRQPSGLVVFDLEGDQDLDILVANTIESSDRLVPDPLVRDIWFLVNDGGGSFSRGPGLDLDPPAEGLHGVGAADLDGDGALDLLVAHARGITPLLNRGNGVFMDAGLIDLFPNVARFVARDLDGDGAVDLAASSYHDGGGLKILRNSGGGAFAALEPEIAVRQPTDIAALDVEGDGDLDLAVGVLESPSSSHIAVYLNDGRAGFTPFQRRFPVGDQPTAIASADLDGAGGPDLVMANRGSNNASVLLNRTARLLEPDCDGNGRLDACDPDGDGDGVNDTCDLCPGEDDREDLNGDGLPDCLGNSLQKLVEGDSVRPFMRGDSDANGELNISDAVLTLHLLFLDPSTPVECLRSMDSNDDGEINLTDPVRGLAFLFLGGVDIPAPYPDCGVDLEIDSLSCESYPSCAR